MSGVQSQAIGGSEGLSKIGILYQKTRDTSGEVVLKGSQKKNGATKLSGSSVDYHLGVCGGVETPGLRGP